MAGLFGHIRLDGKASLQQTRTLTGAALDALLSWRPRPGAAITVSDASGALYRARLIGVEEGRARLLVFEEAGALNKDPFREIYLLQALPEKERMELIIQKTTELGVTHIIPFGSKRSISLEQREARQGKSHRWQDIALNAARQSRGFFIPVVLPYRTFEDALDTVKDAGFKIALWERPGISGIKTVLRDKALYDAEKIAILSGPEGGLGEDEMDRAASCGFTAVSLGQRVLRAETAPIIAIGLLSYELEQ
ncbi:MAG: 16S rRNA (uracil(1498)-N(3))-methyltransferase [Deltaproteobacteria bacterium]|nr:16S rRNA (uracil(1498)-N(3))-methyltransferase [Deltaproteobacteria bacterium]